MARRNIYLADARQGLYEEAALMAGSLSAAIDIALEAYVRQVRAGWLRTSLFDLPVGRGPDLRHLQVRARLLGEYALPDAPPGRVCGVQVFQGQSGRLGAWVWSDPDWSIEGRRIGMPAGCEDWYERWGVGWSVHDDLTDLCSTFPLDEAARRELEVVMTPHVVEEVEL